MSVLHIHCKNLCLCYIFTQRTICLCYIFTQRTIYLCYIFTQRTICLCYIFPQRTYVCVTYSLREPYVCVTYSLQFFHPYCILICHHSFSECCFSTACIYALSTLMDDRLCCSLILAKLAHFLPVAFPLSITSGHLQLSSTFHLQSSKQSLYQ